MAMRKEDLYKLIDNVPVENFPEIEQFIKRFIVPTEEPTEEEIKAIEAGKQEIKQGESYTLDELRKMIDNGVKDV